MVADAFPLRFMAVLSADVEAFSRLMSLDGEHCLTEWRHHMACAEALAERHAGRLFGVAGDSFMAEFANPVEAIQFARAMQAEVAGHNAPLPRDRRMDFRMGLNIGSAMVEDGRLYGDAVNIAARLQELAPPGGIVVSEALLAHVASLVDAGWQDLGQQHLRNIGVPVRPYLMHADAAAAVTTTEAIAAVQAASDVYRNLTVPGLSGKPTLAVLPFEVHSAADASRRYLEDAVPEELIRRLAALRSFPIIDKASSFALRNIASDSARVGAALNARYLVYGAVTAAGRRTSLTVSLVDAEHRRTLWKERYDGEPDRPATIDDDVILRITASLGATVDRVEQARSRRRPIAVLDVDELVQRSAWHQNKLSRSHSLEARRLLGLALERDPEHIEALIQLSWWYFWKIWTQRGDKGELTEMRQLARRAMQLDASDARTHMLYGIAELMTGNPRGAVEILAEAIALDPSLSVAHASMGSAYVLAGEPEPAVQPLLVALRLNPHSTYLFHQFGELAAAHLLLCRWDESRVWAERSLRLRPAYWYARVIAVAASEMSGDGDGATVALSQLLSNCPRFRLEHLYWLPFTDRRAQDEIALALRRAGFTERSSNDGARRRNRAQSPRLQ